MRILNIKSLLLTFYICFPPSRNEALNLEIVKSKKEAKTKEAAIYIENNKIFIFIIILLKRTISQLSLI